MSTRALFPTLLISLLSTVVLTGCGDKAAKVNQTAAGPAATQSASAAPLSGETERAKQRIEREAAASKMLDEATRNQQIAKDTKEQATKDAAQRELAAREAAKQTTTPPVQLASTAPVPLPATGRPSTPAAQPVAPAPVIAPKVEPIAAPKADPEPVAAPVAPRSGGVARVVSRESPEFPREAVRAGVSEGRVSVRMSVDANGNVTNVSILDAQPRRVFDRAVREAVSRWKFDTGNEGRTAETEIVFKQ